LQEPEGLGYRISGFRAQKANRTSNIKVDEGIPMDTNTSTFQPSVTWDYTEHAVHYDRRADYSSDAIDSLLKKIGCNPSLPVADIGAGTGKLTKELLKHGLTVRSVEPNDAMRAIGIKNTKGELATWSVGTGEATGLPAHSVYAIFFGSSFNVVDQNRALAEASRILVPDGWFACMWNHRDLDDPIQQRIETLIKSSIPTYSYGSRREDPTNVINTSGYFSATKSIEGSFVWEMPKSDIVVAWKSHATLKRQAGNNSLFDGIIHQIAVVLEDLPDVIDVPYRTRIYFAQKLK
jgi:ubiquinone/menaquinone biosynthesis C-methylase UbiE